MEIPGLSGFLDEIGSELGRVACEKIFAKFLHEGALKEFRNSLEQHDPNKLQQLIEKKNLNVNGSLTFADGQDVYSGSLLTIAIMYQALMKQETVSCVRVHSIMLRIVY
jgi:hypothetical protein